MSLTAVSDQTVEILRRLRNGFMGTGLLRHDKVVTAEGQREWWAALDHQRNRYFLALDGERVLGFVSAVQPLESDIRDGAAEVGVMLATPPGDDLAESAFDELLRHCFQTWGLNSVRFIYPRAEGNLRVLADRAGFVQRGTQAGMVEAWLDCERFAAGPYAQEKVEGAAARNILAFVAKWVGLKCLDFALEQFSQDRYDIIVGSPEQDEICTALEGRGIAFSRLTPETVARIEAQDPGHYDWLLNLWGGHIFKASVLSRARQSLNIHPSYLPFCRGRDPVVWAVRQGVPAGVTLHAITEGVDEGPIWYRERVDYQMPCKGGVLYDRVVDRAWRAFHEQWPEIRTTERQPWPQPAETRTFRRVDLIADRDIDMAALAEETGESLLLRVLAHDFHPDYSAHINIGGVLYNIRLDIERVKQGKDT